MRIRPPNLVCLAMGLCALVSLSPTMAPARLAALGTPDVRFTATGTAGMRIEGKTTELAIVDDQSTIVLSVPLGRLETGIGLRDSHMKKYLEEPRYPKAELRVPRASLRFPQPNGEVSGDAKGELSLHGQTRPVAFHYVAQRSKSCFVSATMKINMNDFGIAVPSYLGIAVKPDVDVAVKFEAVDNP